MSSSTTNTQQATPYAAAQPLLDAGLSDAMDVYKAGGFKIDPFTGDMVADLNPMTTQGVMGVAGAVPDMVNAANSASGVVSGIANTGSDAMAQSVMEQIMPAINASFAGSGMTGSSLHAQNLAKGLGSAMAQGEMALNSQRMQAAGMLPGLAADAASPYQAMIGAGQILQNQQQNEIDAQVQQDYLAQGADMSAIQNLLSIGSGVGGQFGTQTSTQKQKPGLFGVLGAGLQTASLF